MAALQAAGLSGRVLELNSGAPVAEARVSLLSLSKDTRAGTQTDARGAFHFDNVAPGRHRVDVSKPGYAAGALRLICEGDSSVLIRLAKAGRIRGRITTAEGEPAQGAQVFALAQGSGDPAGNAAQVDDQGRYELSGLPPGDYAVGVSYSGAGSAAGATALVMTRTFSIVSGEQYDHVDAALPPGEACNISGRVANSPANGPVLVTLALGEAPAIPVAQAITGGEGRFRMEMIHPGRYEVLAIGPTDVRLSGGMGGLLAGDPFFGRVDVSLNCPGDADALVSMLPGRKTAFRLAQVAKGAPCGKTGRLDLEPVEKWGSPLKREAQVSVDAPTVVSPLAPGKYRIDLSDLAGGCFYPGEPLLDLAENAPETVTLEQAPGAAIEGQIQAGPHDAPAEFVIVLRPDQPAAGDPALWISTTNKQGRFSFEQIRPGNYRVLVASAAEWSDPQWKLQLGRMTPVRLAVGKTEMDLPAPKLTSAAGLR